MKKSIVAFLVFCLIFSFTAFAVAETKNDLDTRVDRLVRSIETLDPSGTAEQQLAEYSVLRSQIEVLTNETDSLAEKYESDYLSSQITREEYVAIEQNLSQLTEQLEKAQEVLDITFGVQD